MIYCIDSSLRRSDLYWFHFLPLPRNEQVFLCWEYLTIKMCFTSENGTDLLLILSAFSFCFHDNTPINFFFIYSSCFFFVVFFLNLDKPNNNNNNNNLHLLLILRLNNWCCVGRPKKSSCSCVVCFSTKRPTVL